MAPKTAGQMSLGGASWPSRMRAVVVTACTQRRGYAPHQDLRARDLPSGALTGVVGHGLGEQWRPRTERRRRILYAGRGFGEARAAAQSVRGLLLIVSAGLGLLAQHTLIPAYSLTVVSGSPDFVLARVGTRVPASRWWRELQDRSPFAIGFEACAENYSDVPILMALPSAYFAMVQDELLAIAERSRARLRLFGRSLERRLDSELKPHVMPYDDRLDGAASPIRGTQSDFGPRALRHFVDTILPALPLASAEEHGRAVQKALSQWPSPIVRRRPKLSDDEVLSLIRQHWHDASGQSSRMLRVLRDDLAVACEQSRFRNRFHKVT